MATGYSDSEDAHDGEVPTDGRVGEEKVRPGVADPDQRHRPDPAPLPKRRADRPLPAG